MSLSLGQKSFLFVALSALVLLGAYTVISFQYVRQVTNHLLEERVVRTTAIAENIDELIARAGAKLTRTANLPALIYGLESLELNREGRQITASETLHYIFLESDMFTDGVFLLNREGKILWSEPPDLNLLDAQFAFYPEIQKQFSAEEDRSYVTTLASEGTAKRQVLISAKLVDRQDHIVGALVGALPVEHANLLGAIERQSSDPGMAAHLTDSTGRVIASTDLTRLIPQEPGREPVRGAPGGEPLRIRVTESQPTASGAVVTVVASMRNAPWTVTLVQAQDVALADAHYLRFVLTGFGIVFIALATAIYFFVVRSFTRPVELLIASVRSAAAGDLNVRFTSGRTDEIGVLAAALDEMNSKRKQAELFRDAKESAEQATRTESTYGH